MRIQVRGQNLYVEPGHPGNEMDFREMLEFSFTRDWDRYVKFAQFTQNGRTFNTMLADNRCHLPPEIRNGPCYLNVTGMTGNSRERASSCYVTLRVMGDDRDHPGHAHAHDLYGEVMERVDEAILQRLKPDPALEKADTPAEAAAVGRALREIREAMPDFSLDASLTGEGSAAEAASVGRALREIREAMPDFSLDASLTREGSAAEAASVGRFLREIREAMPGFSLDTGLSRRGDAAEAAAVGQAVENLRQDLRSLEQRVQGTENQAGLAQGLQEKTAALQAIQTQHVQTLQHLDQRMDAMGERLAGSENREAQTGQRLNGLQEALQRLRGEAEDMQRQAREAVEQLRQNVQSGGEENRRKLEECARSIDVLNQTVLNLTVARPEGHRPPMEMEEIRDRLRRCRGDMDRLREDLGRIREEILRNREMTERCVQRDQGRQNQGRVLGILPDGSVSPVDMRMAAQAQADWLQGDSTQADFIRNKPFLTRNGYPQCDGLVLLSPDRVPYLLTVNEAGDLTVNVFQG